MEISIEQRKAQRSKAKRKEVGLAILMIAPFLLIFICFSVIPFIMGFSFSFMKYDPYAPEDSSFVGFLNFKNLFDADNPISMAFWKSFLTMFLFSAVSIPALIIVPLFLAYEVNKQPPGYKIFRALLYLPSIVSITIAGAVFCNMFRNDSSGVVNAILGTDIDWLGGKPWEDDFLRWVVMFIARIWMGIGGNFVIFSAALRDVPKSLYEACEMDGGNRWTKILKVTLPHIKFSLNMCIFNTFIGAMNMYALPYTFSTLSNQDIDVAPVMWIQKYLLGGMAYSTQTGYLCAGALVFGIVLTLVTIIERKVTAPSLKRTKNTAKYEQMLLGRKTLLHSSVKREEHNYD